MNSRPHNASDHAEPAVAAPVVADAIVRAVAYADVFDYPLLAHEVHRYLPRHNVPLERVRDMLSNGRLVPAHLARREPYYHLPGRDGIVAIRQQRARVSAALWPLTLSYGRLIAWLPFVRMVAVTGSLAVDNAAEDADVDYLVVTAHGHVWLTRAAIILVVRLAKMRHQLQLCPNFVISESAMELAPTMFNARELAQMVPLAGLQTYRQLRRANGWSAAFLPNAFGPPQSLAGPNGIIDLPSGPIRKAAERALSAGPALRLERWEMNRKVRRFTALAGQGEAQFSADWCKGHFDNHGDRIAAAYSARLNAVDASAAARGTRSEDDPCPEGCEPD